MSPTPVDVAVEVQEHLNRWNAPAENNTLSALIGKPAPEGDTRVSSNAGWGDQSQFTDDADLAEVPTDDNGDPDYREMKNADLEAHLKARGLSTAGTKEEMAERLEEDDESGE